MVWPNLGRKNKNLSSLLKISGVACWATAVTRSRVEVSNAAVLDASTCFLNCQFNFSKVDNGLKTASAKSVA